MILRRVLLVLLLAAAAPDVRADGERARGITVSAGLGVNALHAADLADLATATNGARVDALTSAAEFIGAVGVPVGDRWTITAEYARLVGGYEVQSGFGSGRYAFAAHLPSIIVHYSLTEEPAYSVLAGVGGGYHAGSVRTELPGASDRFTGTGPGVLVDLRGNTSLGDGLYALLGVHVRWSAIGELTNSDGFVIPTGPGVAPPTLSFVSAGAKLGVTYRF